MRTHLTLVSTLCALIGVGGAVLPVLAQTPLYHVALNTSGLAASASAPFSLDFQLDDGGTPGNNGVTLTNFRYNGGSVAAAPSSLSGGASGNADSTVTLIDTSLLNELVQTFTPGAALTFDVSMTDNANTTSGSSPDEFSFALLDNSGNEVVTTAANGAFLTIDTNPGTLIVTTAGTPAGGAPFIAAPAVTPVAVPEAGTWMWLTSMAGVCGANLCLRRRKRSD